MKELLETLIKSQRERLEEYKIEEKGITLKIEGLMKENTHLSMVRLLVKNMN